MNLDITNANKSEEQKQENPNQKNESTNESKKTDNKSPHSSKSKSRRNGKSKRDKHRTHHHSRSKSHKKDRHKHRKHKSSHSRSHKKHHHHRSKSRSERRQKKRSRTRSRSIEIERNERNKKQRENLWDSPPKDIPSTNALKTTVPAFGQQQPITMANNLQMAPGGIYAQGGGQAMIGMPANPLASLGIQQMNPLLSNPMNPYAGMMNQGMIPAYPGVPVGIMNGTIQNPAQLQAMNQQNMLRMQAAAGQNDKKLYIGNLPPNITTEILVQILNSALQKMNVITDPGQPVIGAWINQEGHFGFIDFRTAEEATKAFVLNNVSIFDKTLKVGRPKNYMPMTGGMMQYPTVPGMQMPDSQFQPNMIPGMGQTQDQTQAPPHIELPPITKIQPPSRVLILKNMVKLHELEIDEEYKEIMEDVKDECEQHGKVLSIKIPRPINGQTVEGVGKIFVEFETIEAAKEARKQLVGKTFSENTVECSYHPPSAYLSGDFKEQ